MHKDQKLLQTVQLAMLAGLGVVLMLAIRFPIFPAAPFLEYDMGDVPVIVGGMLFGPISGLLILFVVSFIQAVTVSASSGWVGFVMHFASSGVWVLLTSLVYKKIQSKSGYILGLIIGTIAMVGVMIPLNLIFTVHFLGVPSQAVKDMILPIIIPFNSIKGVSNSIIAFLLFLPLKRILDNSNIVFRKKGKQRTGIDK